MEGLSREQSGLVEQFKQVVHTEDDVEAVRALERHGWDLGAAVAEHLDDQATPDDHATPERANGSSMRRRRGSDDHSGAAATDGAAGRPAGSADGGPGRAGGSDDENQESPGFPWNLVGLLGSFLLAPLRVLTGIDGNVAAQAAAELFINEFNSKCVQAGHGGERAPSRPNFVQASFREALARAAREHKLLLVYLHSGQHPDSGDFCNNVLCSRPVSDMINERVVAWGGCVEFADAYRLSTQLEAATYPHVAILQPPADERQSKAKLVDRIEGRAEFESLLPKLTVATDQHAGVVAERVAQRYAANERQRLREEQDQALQRAMEEDRRREEERRRKQQQEEEAQRAAEEQARREQEQAEQAEAALAATIEAKRKRLPAEPAMEKGKVTTIRFNLPNGSRFQRRFAVTDTLGTLRDFVDLSLHDASVPIKNYALVLNFPKRTFDADHDATAPLTACDMVPQAVLFVQDLDS